MNPPAPARLPQLATTKHPRRRKAPWTICCLTSSYVSGTESILIAHFWQKGHVKSAKCFVKNATVRRKGWQMIQQQKKLQIPTSREPPITKFQTARALRGGFRNRRLSDRTVLPALQFRRVARRGPLE